MKYRKKPVVVEAFQLTDDPEYESPPWFTQAVADETYIRIRLYDPDAGRRDARQTGGLHHPGCERGAVSLQAGYLSEDLRRGLGRR